MTDTYRLKIHFLNMFYQYKPKDCVELTLVYTKL